MWVTVPTEPELMKSITFGSCVRKTITRTITAGIRIGSERRTMARTSPMPPSERMRSSWARIQSPAVIASQPTPGRL